jgi:TonB family protein
LSLLLLAQRSIAQVGTVEKAVPISRPAPNYPNETLSLGREGWVALSYVVLPDGAVAAPMIEDSSGLQGMEQAALKAVRDWRYRPATRNGAPVDQSMTRTIFYLAVNETQKGASTTFAAKFRNAQESVEERELAKARALIDDLESTGRFNLYEDALFWWLKYQYLIAAGGATLDEQRDTLSRAIGYERIYLPPDAFVSGAVQLFNLRARTGDYAGALSLLDRLEKSEDARSAKTYEAAVQALVKADAQIKRLVDGDTDLKSDGKITRFDYWVHGLMRRSFSITGIDGRIDAVEIRCENKYARYDSVAGEPTWTIPATWGTCGAYVRGTPGTTFVLYEFPKER